jgi:transposase-like protein
MINNNIQICKKLYYDFYNLYHYSDECVFCNSKNIELKSEIKFEYKCSDCKKIFSPKKNSIFSKIRLSEEKWIKMLNCMLNDYTLEETAKELKFTQSNTEEKWLMIYEAVDWNKYNIDVRKAPNKKIYASYEVIFN